MAADRRPANEIVVEFYGIPRRRAGCAAVCVSACTLGEALSAAGQLCPGLADLLDGDDRLNPHYLVSLDGRAFLVDLNHPLRPGDRLVLLSRDAGG